ncbi:hypothetical protein RFI_22394, partial [Reticulomyxa filosa]
VCAYTVCRTHICICILSKKKKKVYVCVHPKSKMLPKKKKTYITEMGNKTWQQFEKHLDQKVAHQLRINISGDKKLLAMEQDMMLLEKDQIVARYQLDPTASTTKPADGTDNPTSSVILPPSNNTLETIYSESKKVQHQVSFQPVCLLCVSFNNYQRVETIDENVEQPADAGAGAGAENSSTLTHERVDTRNKSGAQMWNVAELMERKQMAMCLALRQQWWMKLNELSSASANSSKSSDMEGGLDNTDLFFELCSAIELSLSSFRRDQASIQVYFTLSVRESLRVVMEVLRCIVLDYSLTEISQRMEKYYDAFVILREYEECIEKYLTFWT